MSDSGLALLAVLAAVTLGVLSFGPVPEVGFVLQASGVGALVATAIALRTRCRNEPTKRTTIVSTGALVGAGIGALVVLLDALLAGLP